DDGDFRKFDRVLCDAPIGLTLQRTAMHESAWERFTFGHPGRGVMDNAFVQHAAQSLKPDGTAVALVSHGFLFRSGADARVRERLIESHFVKAVIGLPAKLRAETAIETALIVFSPGLRSEDVFFIDASA